MTATNLPYRGGFTFPSSGVVFTQVTSAPRKLDKVKAKSQGFARAQEENTTYYQTPDQT
jgi:hypothetical protein